jgi:Transglutaminase-like superfamily
MKSKRLRIKKIVFCAIAAFSGLSACSSPTREKQGHASDRITCYSDGRCEPAFSDWWGGSLGSGGEGSGSSGGGGGGGGFGTDAGNVPYECLDPRDPRPDQATANAKVQECMLQYGATPFAPTAAGGYSNVNASWTTFWQNRERTNQAFDSALCSRGDTAVGRVRQAVQAAASLPWHQKACIAACVVGKFVTYRSGDDVDAVDAQVGFHRLDEEETPDSALLTGGANCLGYSAFAADLMREMGLDAEIVVGPAPSGGPGTHAWVRVTALDTGRVYYLEPQRGSACNVMQ